MISLVFLVVFLLVSQPVATIVFHLSGMWQAETIQVDVMILLVSLVVFLLVNWPLAVMVLDLSRR